jgi:ATP-dependent DNA helicase RecG
LAIQPGGETWEDRRRLQVLVDAALAGLAAGVPVPELEREGVDFKEEAGRRGRGGMLLAGQRRSEAVASALADEVACLANTPGGGALIVGVADDGTAMGAASDRDWLRQRIHQRVDLAPAVEERFLPDGTRLLVVLVAEAREPVDNISGQLRWRVGSACAPVDRSEWWNDRLRRQGSDPLLAETQRTLGDIGPGAIVATRRLIRGADVSAGDLGNQSDREMFTRLGVLLPNGHLTAAGVHMFCPAPRTVLELAALDVRGGDVISLAPDLAGLSLVEQLQETETRLDVLDTSIVLRAGLVLESIRQIPWPAVREALLNAVVHRDWLPAEPVQLTWIQADGSLDVVSPGGFQGGVNANSVLSTRYSRNPALADLARAMGLVERQGVGVDRMYREMVVLGHRPPTIREEAGPRIRTRLVGGIPVTAMMTVASMIEPAERRRDVVVAIAAYVLARDGFLSAVTLGGMLQVPRDEADDALDMIATCTLNGEQLIRPTASGVWLPAQTFVARATADEAALERARRRSLFTWYRPSALAATHLVRSWLAVAGRITSHELAELTSLTPAGALNMLNRMESNGVVRRGAVTRGRGAHFIGPDAPTQPV